MFLGAKMFSIVFFFLIIIPFILMTRTLSIAIKENTYQELKSKIGPGKINSFVNQAVEKKLLELDQEEKREKEKLKQQLIKGYQIRAKNEKLKKILRNYGEMSWEDLSIKLEKKNVNYITFDFGFREP